MEFFALLIAAFLLFAMLVLLVVQQKKLGDLARQLESRKENEELAALRAQMEALLSSQSRALGEQLNILRQQQVEQGMQTEQKLENLRRTLSYSLDQVQRQNQRQLDEIRSTVDEKLQTTLEKKLNDSFAIVSQRLEQVYKGLGEMQTLAVGVGDLKKVLSNVKTRGTLGELQLGAILEQILAPEQYARNVCAKKGSAAVVEFAIKLPGDGEKPVWMPVDSKYPGDAYEQLLDAYDTGDAQQVEQARRVLRDRLRSFAKDIHDKYIDPPNTTDFALMFLPVEGLYAEAVRLGMIEQLQKEFKVNLAGPTTTAALLNSLQLGFRTLAVQKRSAEVWKVLGAVKNEFSKFALVLEGAQKRLNQANEELDKLVGVRTRQIQRTLREVELPAESQEEFLSIEGGDHV
mgnify:FL=1